MQLQQPLTATPFPGHTFQTELVHSQCGLEFELPATWKASEEETELYFGYVCALGVRPPNWQQLADKSDYVLNDYAILVVLHPGPFEDAARQALFENVDGTWYATGGGRGGALEADLILSDGRSILRGMAPYGLTLKDGESYGGLGVAVRALVADRSAGVIILETDWDTAVEPVSLEEAFELILRTVRVLEP
jgi:hypothetical protein